MWLGFFLLFVFLFCFFKLQLSGDEDQSKLCSVGLIMIMWRILNECRFWVRKSQIDSERPCLAAC